MDARPEARGGRVVGVIPGNEVLTARHPVAPRGAPVAVAPVVVVVGVRPKAPVEATVQAPSAKE